MGVELFFFGLVFHTPVIKVSDGHLLRLMHRHLFLLLNESLL